MKMTKRLTALLLALMMIFGTLAAAAEGIDMGDLNMDMWNDIVNAAQKELNTPVINPGGSGQEITPTIPAPPARKIYTVEHTVDVGVDTCTMTKTDSATVVSAQAGQWQVAMTDELWVNITGETGTTLKVTYAMLANTHSSNYAVRQVVGEQTTRSVVFTVNDPVVQQDAPALMTIAREGEGNTDPDVHDVNNTYNIIINYKFENNEIVSDPYTANLAEGSSFSATVTFPTVQGYLPYIGETQQNSMELNYPSVSEDVTINVVYKPTNVNYTVIHYQQNVDNDQYTVKETETKQGLTKSQVPEVAKTYEGFYSLVYERPEIAADGSTVIEVYYDRYYYLMNFDMDGGYGTDPVYARYGASVREVKTPTKAGYNFIGWSEIEDGTERADLPTTMPAANKTYYAIWEVGGKAKVTIVFWGENADDEQYSYLSENTKEISLDPGTTFKYSEGEMLVCDKEVHPHTDACIGCGKIEHTHSAVGGSCYTLTCTTESHDHSKDCYGSDIGAAFSASISEHWVEGNTINGSIGQSYYTYILGNKGTGNKYIYIDGTWYRYSGSAAIGSVISTSCGKEETTHTHNNDCYTLTCTAEEHTHDAKCYTCGKEQHTHNSDCYMQGAGLDTAKWKFVRSEEVTVAADGSSVVNVYYDRIEYSVQFYSGSGYTEYEDIKITAKWGAFIGNSWPSRNNSSTWAINPSKSDYDVGGPYQVYLQEMPVGGDKFYGPKTDNGTQSAYYYVEVLPGETGTETYNNKSYKLHHTDTSPGSGYVVTDDDKYAIQGFTFVGFTATRNNNGNYRYNGAKFYYTRNSYKLTFNDQYNDVRSESVKYEVPLSTYKDYEPDVPSQYEPGSVVFGGWYQNPQCTGEEYKLDAHTMPANDIILYAKWVPVTRTVKFYLTESSAEVYKPATAETAASFTVPHGDNIAEEYVENHLEKSAMNEAKPNGDYTFVMWYYYENGDKKPFDPTTQIRKDLILYGEWSSNTLKNYTVQYVLKEDHSVKVADDLTGSGLAGTTKTFDAKGGTDLYAAYQEGYFPTVQSQSLLLDIDKETLTITFEYVPMPAVPYTVRYVTLEKPDGEYKEVIIWVNDGIENGKIKYVEKTAYELKEDKVVSDNRKAVVTETFEPISGYMPDAYQKRLVVVTEPENGDNTINFIYTKDTERAYYKITHYIQNTDGATWTVHAESQVIGDIGTRYTASPMTIPGYTYKETKYVVNKVEVTDVTAEGAKLTENGLEINLYYVRNEYPYQVRYLEQGSGEELAKPKNGTGKYGQMISESAIDIDGYEKVDPTSDTLNIRIDEGEGAPNLNIITFYYMEKEVTINYVAVGPDGATDFGSVSPESETVKVKSGDAKGSTATPGDGFKFVGWYKDAACTQAVDTSWVTNNKITPAKTDGKNVAATYYAKFEYDVSTLTITKTGMQDGDSAIFKVTVGSDTYRVVLNAQQNTVTLAGLKVGASYSIAEDGNWSNRYTCKVTDGNAEGTIAAPTNPVSVTFKNTKKNDTWLHDESSVKNVFTTTKGGENE